MYIWYTIEEYYGKVHHLIQQIKDRTECVSMTIFFHVGNRIVIEAACLELVENVFVHCTCM